MADYLTVAEVYLMQHRLIEMFGGLHGVRDKGAVEAAVFRPQTATTTPSKKKRRL
jgi:hypothetical protein